VSPLQLVKGGLIGEKLVNVLEINLELHTKYGDPA
jgi:hypothetical protein